jgi:hypothetical protein
MIIKPSGRSALILATGLFVFFAGPVQAATAADDSTADPKPQNATTTPATPHKHFRHGLHHRKSYAHRKFHRVALKATADTNTPANVADTSPALSNIPPSVANANALFASPGILGESARVMTARASELLQAVPDNPANALADAEPLLVAADQLNDVDRSLREGGSSAAIPANPPPAPVAASSRESSTWDETSLIGKIFIGFGALLTMASAARMFMA